MASPAWRVDHRMRSTVYDGMIKALLGVILLVPALGLHVVGGEHMQPFAWFVDTVMICLFGWSTASFALAHRLTDASRGRASRYDLT